MTVRIIFLLPQFGGTNVISAFYLQSDLLITVNFTTLGIDSTALSNSLDRTVSIVVGLQNNTADLLRNTQPIPLVPNVHLFGGVLTALRYAYKHPKLASLGTTSSVCPSVYFLISIFSLWHSSDNSVCHCLCPIPDARIFVANSPRRQHCYLTPVPAERFF